MNKRSLQQETIAILASVLFLGLGFFAGWFSRTFLRMEGDAIFVSLLFIPIIVYLVFSGRLKELRAGGLEAKFVDVAGQSVEKSVEIASQTIELSTEEMAIVAKGDIGELQRRLQNLDESKPIILTLALGKAGYYNREEGLGYIKALSQYRTFKFVVILDSENKFVSYIPSWAMLYILRSEGLGKEFVRIISEGDVRDLQRYPGVVMRTISTETTNLDALREMTAQNLESLVVIDEDRKLKGVVEREQILSKLVLGMAK